MTLAERNWRGDPARRALALHCSMGSSGYWGRIHDRLGGIVTLSAFDAPGHGRSPDWDPASGDFHDAVTAAAAARIDGPVDLIGHSLGATVALRLAVENPSRVRSLTLIEPVLFAAAGPEAANAPIFSRMAALLDEGRDEEATRVFLALWGEGDFDALPEATRARMVSQIRIVHALNGALTADRAHILRPGGLESIAAPVMLIRGGDSPPVIEAIGDALAARLGDVGRAVVPGAGHMLPITHPEQVGDLVRVNLERV